MLLPGVDASAQSAAFVSLHGKIVDAETNEGLAYATVQFDNDATGTRSDIDGNFLIESKRRPKRLRIYYVGYKAVDMAVPAENTQDLRIALEPIDVNIKEVTVRPKKYRNRDNPAVDLIEEVFKHRNDNRKEGLDYYEYEVHEKLQLDINGITDKFRRKWYFKKFQVIFDNVDTNRVDNKVAMPTYLRERIMHTYYRKDPKSKKDYLLGEAQTSLNPEYNVDENGVSNLLSNMYQEVDIYASTIPLLTTEFMGPVSATAPLFYRFYIVDTVTLNGKQFADVFFSPRNKTDLAFIGNMLVALDSTYAVRRVEMGISKQINLNFVTNLHIEQEFDFVEYKNTRRLMLVKDAMTMDFNIFEKGDGRSFLARKTVSFKDYKLNEPRPDSLFMNSTILERDTGKVTERPEAFWQLFRHQPLTWREAAIGETVDSVQRIRAFRTTLEAARILGSGFKKIGAYQVGPISTFYSFNGVEGNRFRFGGRTNRKFYKNWMLEGYVAYGTLDQQWKGMGRVTYAFGEAMPRRFPLHQLVVNYLRDLRVPGIDVTNWQPDNIFLSFQRGINNKMVFNKVLRAEYAREFRNGVSYFITAQHRNLPAAGDLKYETEDPDSAPVIPITAELGATLRFAPNEKFYQGGSYRVPMLTKFPVFTLGFRAGFRGIAGSQFSYQRLSLGVKKTFFVAPFGRSEWTLDAAKIFGILPYPLLELPRANQSYAFDWYSYSLMNFLEFVGDQYASLTVHHNLNGFLLNKIPLIKKLQWREVGSFKILYSSLGTRNTPTSGNDLMKLPTDAAGNPVTFVMGRLPYIEYSVGIANIFKVVRFDFVKRLTYTDLPNVTKWGIRFSFQGGF